MLQRLTDLVFRFDTNEQIRLRQEIIATAKDLNILYHNALKNLGNFLFLLGFYFSNVWKLVWWHAKRLVISSPTRKKQILRQIRKLQKELFYSKVVQICIAGFIPISISVYY